jgi:probable rRNA maturation factor
MNLELSIAVQINDEKWLQWFDENGWVSFIDNIGRKVFTSLGFLHDIELSLLLTNDLEIQTLNATYRNKNKPTNVLSFPLHDPEILDTITSASYPIMLGDIALSLETIQKESTEKASFLHHVSHLLTHGMLHLMGYDHEEDLEAEEMEALEIEILQQMGISNPYQ